VEIEQVFARFREIKQGIGSRRKSSSIWFGEHKSHFQGSGYDIAGVDQWRPGQPLRDVAWRLSLRRYPHRLFKIERLEPKQMPTLLVLDLSSSMLFEIARESSKAMLALDLIGAIGLTRAKLHDPVGLLAFSDRIELFLKPRLGSSRVFQMAQQIFEKLELARQFPSARRADFSLALRFLAARVKTRHSIVLMSDAVDFTGDSTDFKRLRRLAWKHDIILLILDDPDEFEVPGRFGFFRVSDMETGQQAVISARKAALVRSSIEQSRTALQRRLMSECGVDSTVLTPQEYFTTLSEFLRSGRRR
jgi:uncharacterized protein (DUF58 family)